MKNKLILLIFLFGSVQASLFAQGNGKIIDFEGHLTTDQVTTIEELIKNSGVNISVVFFNVNEIMGFPLKDPRSVSDYIELWTQNNKDAVLVVFSNMKADEASNYWEDNLQIVSTIGDLDISDIKPFVVQDMVKLKYKGEDKTKYFNLVKSIISLILNKKFDIVKINDISVEFGAGFEFPSSFVKSKEFKTDQEKKEEKRRYKDEYLEIKYTVNKEYAKYIKIRVYAEQDMLVFEQDLDINKTKFEWNGKMNKIGDGTSYITREMSKFRNEKNDQICFKVQISASPSKEFDIEYTQYTYSVVNKEIRQFLEVLKLYPDFHNNIAMYDNDEKNQFRRYVNFIKGELKRNFDMGNISEDPFLYLASNVKSGYYFNPPNTKKHYFTLHQKFTGIVEKLETQNGEKIFFNDKHVVGGSLNLRYNVNKKSEMTDHGLGIAFDMTVFENQNTTTSKDLHRYVHALTGVYTGTKQDASSLIHASEILRSVTSQHLDASLVYMHKLYVDTKDPDKDVEKQKIQEKNRDIKNWKKQLEKSFEIIKSVGDNLKSINLDVGRISSVFDPKWAEGYFQLKQALSSYFFQKKEIDFQAYEKQCNVLIANLKATCELLKKESLNDYLNKFSKAFFLSERNFDVLVLQENKAIVLEILNSLLFDLKVYSEYFKREKAITLIGINGSETTIKKYVDIINNNANYISVINEIIRIENTIKQYPVTYDILGESFIYYSTDPNQNVQYLFLFGITTIPAVELNKWLEFDFLEWMGHNSSNKDAMHFQLEAGYKGKFFDKNIDIDTFIKNNTK